MMGDVILIESEDSENSIIEVEIPKKPSPPVIDIDDDEIILNIAKTRPQDNLTFLAKEIIDAEEAWTNMCDTTASESQISSPDHWTSDMIKFYNDDWGGEEHFIVEKIQEKMDKSSSLWQISKKDLLFMHKKDRRSSVKCWNCCQYGHPAAFCPDPPHVPKCHMCGTPGHLENTCPNSKCLNCGNPSRQYTTSCYKCRRESTQTCSRCQLIGHNLINCSDHWRLFHWTIGNESVKIPDKNIYKPKKEMWCCNCGRKGHLQTECTCRKDCAAFTDFLPFVVSYQQAFNDPIYKSQSNEVHSKKKKSHKKESSMRINPMNKIMKKDRSQFKNKFKRFKKRRREEKERSNKDSFLL